MQIMKDKNILIITATKTTISQIIRAKAMTSPGSFIDHKTAIRIKAQSMINNIINPSIGKNKGQNSSNKND